MEQFSELLERRRTLQLAPIDPLEPLEVALRRGLTGILGAPVHLLERAQKEGGKSVLHRMTDLCVVKPVEFELSSGARLLQALYGPDTDHGKNAFFRAHLRGVLVSVSCLERVALEHYAQQQVQRENTRPKRK